MASRDKNKCPQWKRGSDCGFDEWNFYVAWTIIWIITACLLVATMRRSRTLTGRSRHCLGLAGLAALLNALDCAIPLAIGEQPKVGSETGYSNNPLSLLGTIPLVFALYNFADRWCEVAAYLWSVGNTGHGAASSSFIATTIFLVRNGYKYMAFLHIPFAVLRASSHLLQDFWTSFWMSMSIVWSAWLFVSACCALTVLAVLMYIVAKSLSNVPHSEGLRTVSKVNFWEQIIVNLCMLCIGSLYWVDNVDLVQRRSGNTIGACMALTYIIYWIMHIQVLVFFMAINISDPMYSGEEFRSLIKDSKQKDGPTSLNEQEQQAAPSPATIGSPSERGEEKLDFV